MVPSSYENRKSYVGELYQRIIANPITLVCTQVISLAAFSAVAYTRPILPAKYVIPTIGLGLAVIGCTIYGLKKKLLYHGSLMYTLFNHHCRKLSWCDTVLDKKIILGAIPLKNKGHLEKISKQAKAVLTMLEPFEIRSKGLFSVPVQASDWKKNNVENLAIDSPDFKPVSLQAIDKGVQFIRHQNLLNKCVYVHCKAGRGRSATIVVCYLMKYWNELFPKNPNPSVEKAIAFVKQQRPQINLNVNQRKAIENYFEVRC